MRIFAVLVVLLSVHDVFSTPREKVSDKTSPRSAVSTSDRLNFTFRSNLEFFNYSLSNVVGENGNTYKFDGDGDVVGFSLFGEGQVLGDHILRLGLCFQSGSMSSDAYRYDSRFNYLYRNEKGSASMNYSSIAVEGWDLFDGLMPYDFYDHIIEVRKGIGLKLRMTEADSKVATDSGDSLSDSDSNTDLSLAGQVELGMRVDAIRGIVGVRSELDLYLSGFGYAWTNTLFAYKNCLFSQICG